MGYDVCMISKTQLDYQIQQAEDAVQKAEHLLLKARVRLDTLREMRGSARSAGRRRSDSVDAVVDEGLLGPGKAVKRLVSEQPGVSVDEVISKLQGNIKTKSPDQARLLRNTVANLVHGHVLSRDSQGGLHMNGNGTG